MKQPIFSNHAVVAHISSGKNKVCTVLNNTYVKMWEHNYLLANIHTKNLDEVKLILFIIKQEILHFKIIFYDKYYDLEVQLFLHFFSCSTFISLI